MNNSQALARVLTHLVNWQQPGFEHPEKQHENGGYNLYPVPPWFAEELLPKARFCRDRGFRASVRGVCNDFNSLEGIQKGS